MYKKAATLVLITLFAAFLTHFVYKRFFDGQHKSNKGDIEWTDYNGNGNRDHYSVLQQITKENISHLKPVWVYASGGADTIMAVHW